MHNDRKSLLVRADFVLGHGQAGERRTYKRWRGILAAALPQLLGCERRCPTGAKVRLHEGTEAARFTVWIRFPVQRRPGRKLARRLKARLRARLEAALLPIDGRVVKFGLRRYRKQQHQPRLPFPTMTEAVPAVPVVETPAVPEEPVRADVCGATDGFAAVPAA